MWGDPLAEYPRLIKRLEPYIGGDLARKLELETAATTCGVTPRWVDCGTEDRGPRLLFSMMFQFEAVLCADKKDMWRINETLPDTWINPDEWRLQGV